MNRPHNFKGSVLVAQALPQYLCCGLSFACGLTYQTFCGSTGPLEKAAQDELDLTCGIRRGGLGLLLVQSLLPHWSSWSGAFSWRCSLSLRPLSP